MCRNGNLDSSLPCPCVYTPLWWDNQDTEFPGVVARPVGDFNQPDFQYQTLRWEGEGIR